MGLEELQRIIAESDRGDWNIISCFGLPSFLPWSPDGEFNEHHTRAAVPPGHLHRPRVGIRQTEKLQADWVLEIEEPLDRPTPSFSRTSSTTGCSSPTSSLSSSTEDAVTCRSRASGRCAARGPGSSGGRSERRGPAPNGRGRSLLPRNGRE